MSNLKRVSAISTIKASGLWVRRVHESSVRTARSIRGSTAMRVTVNRAPASRGRGAVRVVRAGRGDGARGPRLTGLVTAGRSFGEPIMFLEEP